MNEDTLKGQWTQLKGHIREQWGKLTDDDVDQIQGKSEQLVGRVAAVLGQRAIDEQDRPTPLGHVDDHEMTGGGIERPVAQLEVVLQLRGVVRLEARRGARTQVRLP